jgi:HSP20 family protein
MDWFNDSFWKIFEKRMEAFRKQMEALAATAMKELPKELVSEPFADINEEDNKIIVKLDMPGVKKEDIQILATEHNIEVRAERKEEKIEKGKRFYKHERAHKAYYRLLPMPAKIKPNTVSAEYQDGVLKIEAEKEEAKVEEKKVKVKVK